MKIKLDHLGVLVKDWNKTVDFYHQLFGLVEGTHVPGGNKDYLYTADHSQALIHLITLESKTQGFADQNSSLKSEGAPEQKDTGVVSSIAWVVEPADFDLLRNKLEALKVEYRLSKDQQRQMWFFDPNGVKLEIADMLLG